MITASSARKDTLRIGSRQVAHKRFVAFRDPACTIDPMKPWYKRARDLMSDLGMNQDELAGRIGKTRPAVGHWLSGRREPNIASIIKLSEIFRCSLEFLLKGKKSAYDVDDVDRTVIALMDDLTPSQIANLINEMERLVRDNKEVRDTPKRAQIARIQKHDGDMILSVPVPMHTGGETVIDRPRRRVKVNKPIQRNRKED